jgi:hypothetical protein
MAAPASLAWAAARSPTTPITAAAPRRARRLHRDRCLLLADRPHDRLLAGRRSTHSSVVSRGLRVPARNALLADVVPPEAYGRA